MRSLKYNLGCGRFKKSGFVNIDSDKQFEPDIIMDLGKLPYEQLKTNSASHIEADHVLEHLPCDIFQIMAELYRILQPGGILKITVPHFSRGFTHSQHIKGFDVTFPYYFQKDHPVAPYGQNIFFKINKIKLHWSAQNYLKKILFPPIIYYPLLIISSIIDFFANISPLICSRLWCYWVGGFEEVIYILQKE